MPSAAPCGNTADVVATSVAGAQFDVSTGFNTTNEQLVSADRLWSIPLLGGMSLNHDLISSSFIAG